MTGHGILWGQAQSDLESVIFPSLFFVTEQLVTVVFMRFTDSQVESFNDNVIAKVLLTTQPVPVSRSDKSGAKAYQIPRNNKTFDSGFLTYTSY